MITNKKRTMNIPIFIPHLGCPNDCVFCNQRHISGEHHNVCDEQQLRQKIEAYLRTGGDHEDIEIAFFGGSFTGIDPKVQKFYLEIATEYVKQYGLKGIRMSTRPDYISEEILGFLKAYPVSAIELGVQSLEPKVLELSKRNHTVEDVYQAVRLIRETNIELGLQVMLGLPGDSKDSFEATIERLIQIQPKTLRIYPTLVITHTELENLYMQGKYQPLLVEEAVSMVAQVLPKILEADIDIIRIGLQANEELNAGAFVAGPYHPAFGELVMDACAYEVFVHIVKTYHERIRLLDSPLLIGANQAIVQRLIGHKKVNKEKIEKFLREYVGKAYRLQVRPELNAMEITLGDVQKEWVATFNRIGF